MVMSVDYKKKKKYWYKLYFISLQLYNNIMFIIILTS